jgi:hypothetical protein
MEAIFKSWLDTEISFENPNLKFWKSIEMNQQQTHKDEVCMLDGWEVTLIYDTSLSPPPKGLVHFHNATQTCHLIRWIT